MPERQNILFVIHCLPFPLRSGGRQAIFNGIAAIREHYNIYVTYPEEVQNPQPENKAGFLQLLGCQATLLPYIYKKEQEGLTLPARIARKLQHLSRRIHTPQPRPVNPYAYWIEELLPQPKAFIAHVNQIIAQHHIDIVQCEMLRNLAFVHALPPTVRKVFVHHELGFVRHALELKLQDDANFDGRSIAASAKDLEVSQLNHYDGIITLSSIDTRKLHEAGVTAPIFDSFAIVKASEKPIQPQCEAAHLSFVGADGHTPNYLGITWFLAQCWDRLLQLNPDYRLTIIGKWSPQHIAELSARYRHLTFTGFVPDLEAALQGTLMIVPIHVGSGIRMKILEAAGLGIPFVSTSIGAEGIPVVDGEHCLIADQPEAFVQAIVRMQAPDLYQPMAQKAYQLVKDSYSIQALGRNRLSIYQSL